MKETERVIYTFCCSYRSRTMKACLHARRIRNGGVRLMERPRMHRSMNAWRWLTRTCPYRDSLTDSPSHAARLLGLALLCSAVGFYRLVYFISLGYALSIGAVATFTVASAHRVSGPPALVQNLLLGGAPRDISGAARAPPQLPRPSSGTDAGTWAGLA